MSDQEPEPDNAEEEEEEDYEEEADGKVHHVVAQILCLSFLH